MNLHLRPRCLSRSKDVVLADFEVPQLGLHLRAGSDLRTCTPYPNKRYRVGCLVEPRRRAVDGILITTERRLREFTTISRWSVDSSFIVTHRVDYALLDDDFDTVTDHMVLWSKTCDGLGGFENRTPEGVAPPCDASPRMEIWADDRGRRIGDVRDTIDANDRIVLRHERFWVPTVEPERLDVFRSRENRIPEWGQAIAA